MPSGAAQAQAVVQPIPDPAADRLAEALRVLGQQPEDLRALLQAGDAALYLGDLGAAEQFYVRARDVAPGDGRVAAGLAVLLVRQARPAEALPLFAAAEQTGIDMAPYAADRGLAYDLVGNNAAAQAEYGRALALAPDNAVTLRLAISQAIAGNQPGFEATLLPLLQQQDLAAFRIRAFALAIVGQEDEAVSIARTMLPERLSSRLAPYLRYMPRLTRAQQAAAANLGRFPQAQQIGSDEPAIAAAAQQPVPVPVNPPPAPAMASTVPAAAPVQATARLPADPPIFAAVGARLVPSGPTLGQRLPASEAPSEPAPAPKATPPAEAASAPVPASGELPPVTGDAAAPAPRVAAARTPVPEAALPPATGPIIAAGPPPQGEPVFAPAPASAPPSVLVPATGAVIVASLPPQSAPVPQSPDPQPATPVVQAVPEPVNLAEAFADFAGAAPAQVAAGGVDITTIAPPRERPAPPPPPPAPPAPPPVPSRHWVQVATGRDPAALAFDWRRIRRTAGDLLARAEPHLAAWNDRSRLLAGPYSAAEAETLVAALKEAGVDSFRFTSARGEEVRPLD